MVLGLTGVVPEAENSGGCSKSTRVKNPFKMRKKRGYPTWRVCCKNAEFLVAFLTLFSKCEEIVFQKYVIMFAFSKSVEIRAW